MINDYLGISIVDADCPELMQQTFWIIKPLYPNFNIFLIKVDFKITVSFVFLKQDESLKYSHSVPRCSTCWSAKAVQHAFETQKI